MAPVRNYKWWFALFGLCAFWVIGALYSRVYIDLGPCGEPDPFFLALCLSILTAGFLYMGVMALIINGYLIVTNVGCLYSHSVEPIFKIDPLDFVKDENTRTELREKIKNYKKSGENYDPALSHLMPMSVYLDGGVKALQFKGTRLGGRAVLIVTDDFMKRMNTGAICLAMAQELTSLAEVSTLPPFVMNKLYRTIPKYVPGKYTILLATEPLKINYGNDTTEAVRAFDENAQEYVWTLGVESPDLIDWDARTKWNERQIKDLNAAIEKKKGSLDYLDKREEAEKALAILDNALKSIQKPAPEQKETATNGRGGL